MIHITEKDFMHPPPPKEAVIFILYLSKLECSMKTFLTIVELMTNYLLCASGFTGFFLGVFFLKFFSGILKDLRFLTIFFHPKL